MTSFTKEGSHVQQHRIGAFFRNLPFLIDVADTESEYWQLHLICRDICRIVFAPVIRKEWLIDLHQSITEHHALLIHIDHSLFTPKLHFLIHYPRLISVFAPVKHMWCMRFESCHQYFKKLARISKNFRNIAYTLAERHQFRKCWFLSGPDAWTTEANIISKQNDISVSSLPTALQRELSTTFMIQETHQEMR